MGEVGNQVPIGGLDSNSHCQSLSCQASGGNGQVELKNKTRTVLDSRHLRQFPGAVTGIVPFG